MKKSNLILNIALIIFLIAIVVFLGSYLYSSLKTSSVKDLNSEEELFKSSKIKFSELRQNFMDWENIEKEYEDFRNILLLKFEDFSEFRGKLNRMIKNNSLSRTKFRIEYKRVLNNEFIKVLMDMRLSGSYFNLKKFINDVHKIDKIVYLKFVKFAGRGNDISADFKMEVYLVK